jgi:hypothetical protein
METKEKCCGHHSWKGNILKYVGYGILGVIGFTGLVVLGGFVIMWLWNWLMPSIFHLATITYWQALGLAILFRLLVGCGGHARGWHHKHKGKHWYHGFHGHCCGQKADCCSSDTDKWKHYDDFWKEEGEKAFGDYVKRKTDS